jgi:hypothetical protein
MGSFHGLNPAMGWLFAVALGLQQRRLGAVVAALGPIAIGHALSIAGVVAVAWALGTFLPEEVLMVAGGLTMLAFAGWKVATRFRHPAWVGMRVGPKELVAWSFLMATAHGAGLMLLPPLLALRSNSVPEAAASGGHHAHHIPVTGADGQSDLVVAVLALGLHTFALFVVTAAIALVVYTRVGVDVLRKAWVNVDLIWIAVLAVAGGVTLMAGSWMLIG